MTANPKVVNAAMAGAAAPPSIGGEPVFAEPWEGRAYGLALETVERLGLDWEQFRSLLIAAIGEVPERPYYESWVVALERLVLDHDSASAGELAAERTEAATYHYDDEVGEIEVAPFAASRVRALAAGCDVEPSATQVEWYHRHDADDRPTGWGIRQFDGAGLLVADRSIGEADWVTTRALLLANATDPDENVSD